MFLVVLFNQNSVHVNYNSYVILAGGTLQGNIFEDWFLSRGW